MKIKKGKHINTYKNELEFLQDLFEFVYDIKNMNKTLTQKEVNICNKINNRIEWLEKI